MDLNDYLRKYNKARYRSPMILQGMLDWCKTLISDFDFGNSIAHRKVVTNAVYNMLLPGYNFSNYLLIVLNPTWKKLLSKHLDPDKHFGAIIQPFLTIGQVTGFDVSRLESELTPEIDPYRQHMLVCLTEGMEYIKVCLSLGEDNLELAGASKWLPNVNSLAYPAFLSGTIFSSLEMNTLVSEYL